MEVNEGRPFYGIITFSEPYILSLLWDYCNSCKIKFSLLSESPVAGPDRITVVDHRKISFWYFYLYEREDFNSLVFLLSQRLLCPFVQLILVNDLVNDVLTERPNGYWLCEERILELHVSLSSISEMIHQC